MSSPDTSCLTSFLYSSTDSDKVLTSENFPELVGQYSITTISKSSPETHQVTLTGDGTEKLYRFCDQDFLERLSALLAFFEYEKDDWMSISQERLTFVYGVICVCVGLLVITVSLIWYILPNMQRMVQAEFVSRCMLRAFIEKCTRSPTHTISILTIPSPFSISRQRRNVIRVNDTVINLISKHSFPKSDTHSFRSLSWPVA